MASLSNRPPYRRPAFSLFRPAVGDIDESRALGQLSLSMDHESPRVRS